MARKVHILRPPRQTQPRTVTPFNTDNYFGRHLYSVYIPNWFGRFYGTESTISSGSHSEAFVGRTQIVPLKWDHQDSPTMVVQSIVDPSPQFNYPDSLKVSYSGTGGYTRLKYDTNDLFPFPGVGVDTTCIVICRPIGNGQPPSASFDPRIVSKDLDYTTNGHDFMVGSTGGGNARARIRIGSSTQTVIPTGYSIQNDAINIIRGYAHGNVAGCSLLREDGSYTHTTGSGSGSYNPRTNTDTALFANGGSNNSNQYNGAIIGVFIFDHPFVTEEELRLFAANPWQVFEPEEHFVFTSVVQAVTATPSEASLTLASAAPTLQYDYSQAPAATSLALAGVAPSVIRADSVTPAVAPLALTGDAPALQFNYARAPSETSLALTGAAPTVARTEHIVVGQDEGSLALTGAAPSLLRQDSITPGAGSLAFASDVPTVAVTAHVVKAPSAAALAFAGAAPTLTEVDVAAPDAGSLALTGAAPTLFREDTLVVGDGALTLAGEAPALFKEEFIVPASGAIALSGEALSLAGNNEVAVAAQTLSLAGAAPTAFRQDAIAASNAVLALAGAAPSVTIVADAAVTPAVGTLTIATAATTRSHGLVLEGYAPSYDIQGGSEPAAGSLTLATSAPIVLFTSPSITPAAAVVVLTGKTPSADSGVTTTRVISNEALTLTGTTPTRAHGLWLYSYAPNVAFSTPSVPKGSLALSGKAVTIANTSTPPVVIPTFHRLLTLSTKNIAIAISQDTADSSLQLTSWVPVSLVTSPTFFPAAATLLLNEQGIGDDFIALPAAGSLALSSQTATLVHTSIRSPAAVTLALASDSYEYFANTQLMRPAAYSLMLDGAALYYGRSITPAAKGIKLNAKLPTSQVNISYVESVSDVALTVSTYEPVANVGPNITVDGAALTLTAESISFIKLSDFYTYPGAGALVLDGGGGGSGISTNRSPGKKALTFVGYAPSFQVKTVQYEGASLQLISLTIDYDVELLFK